MDKHNEDNGKIWEKYNAPDKKAIQEDGSPVNNATASLTSANEDAGQPWSETGRGQFGSDPYGDVGRSWSTNPLSLRTTAEHNEDGGVSWSARADECLNAPFPDTLSSQNNGYKQYNQQHWWLQTAVRQKMLLITLVIFVIIGTLGTVFVLRQVQVRSTTRGRTTQSNAPALSPGSNSVKATNRGYSTPTSTTTNPGSSPAGGNKPNGGTQSTDNSLFVSGSLPVTTKMGQSFSVQLTFQNSGTSTWAGNSYRLACNTAIASVNCLLKEAVGLGGSKVAPGQSFTFTLSLTAPTVPATYTTAWVMTNNGKVFGDTGAVGTVTITGAASSPPTSGNDNATLVTQSTSSTVQEGQQFSISFTLQNIGTTTWSDSGGYTLACTSTCLNVGNVGFNGHTVAPGQQFQFTITQRAPATPGTYRIAWSLQDRGIAFGPTMYINVSVPAPVPPTPVPAPPSPTPMPTTPTPTWQALLQQSAPDCNNPGGTSWNTPMPGTALSCNNGGLLMQQTSSTYYAELDLSQAGNGYYSQSNFRVKVDTTFMNTGDTSTWAGLLVQTPSAPGAAGGFIFVLNAAGQWQLQQVVTGTNIPVVASGSIASNSGQAITMMITVQNGTLYGFINGAQVVTWTDNNNGSSELSSLMVERLHASPSSTILYTNFEMDKWS